MYDTKTHASDNFAWTELDPMGTAGPGDLTRLHLLANNVLEPLRAHLGGQPIKVLSGFRSVSEQQILWNNSTQEERDAGLIAHPGSSQHNFGRAADLEFPTAASRQAVVDYLVTNPSVGGIGLYPWGVHVDTRPREDGVIARWGNG